MTSQFIGSAYLALSALAILVLAQISQMPLCINSQAIEKLTMTDETSVYRCVSRRKVPYSAEFAKSENLINQKVLSFESWISKLWTVKKVSRVQIKIVKHPTVTQYQGKVLQIWDQNLKNTHQLESEVAKIYLRAINPDFFASNELALTSLADFAVKIWSSNQALSYGGMSTYVAHQWWIAYSQLRMDHQVQLFRKIPSLLKNVKTKSFSDEETKNYDQLIQVTQIFSGEKPFYSLIKSRNTFEESSLTASFDYLVLMPQVRSELFKSLYALQSKQKSLNLGIWDGKFLYHVGSRSQIEASSFNKLKVQHLIWESCDDLEIKALLGVSAEVRKLLVVRSCSPQNQPNYTAYIRKGVAGFAALHPQIAFVHLDMPSLNMRKDEAILQRRIFSLMADQSLNKERKSAFFDLFGLEKLNWDQKLQIFVPKSHIDAVESFRVPMARSTTATATN